MFILLIFLPYSYIIIDSIHLNQLFLATSDGERLEYSIEELVLHINKRADLFGIKVAPR